MATTVEKEYMCISGKFFPIEKWHCINENGTLSEVPKGTPGAIPHLGVKMQSDFMWQYSGLVHRLEKYEQYTKYEDVDAAIERLKRWLRDHIDGAIELEPVEYKKLMEILRS